MKESPTDIITALVKERGPISPSSVMEILDGKVNKHTVSTTLSRLWRRGIFNKYRYTCPITNKQLSSYEYNTNR